MDFFIINKKSGFRASMIDHTYLNSCAAPTIDSYQVQNRVYDDFEIYIYPHRSIREDREDRDFRLASQASVLTNGYVHFYDGGLRNSKIEDFIHEVEEGRELEGDYQVVKVTSDGNGFILGSDIGWRQLYHYEDPHCAVFATSIKLIVDSVRSIQERTFGENFDARFIEDSIFRGWFERRHHRTTLFRQIEKLYPYDRVVFHSGSVEIHRQETVTVPQRFKEAYEQDKERFYRDVLNQCHAFFDNVWAFDFGADKSIELLLTGGLDSRATLSFLFPAVAKHGMGLTTKTSGRPEHPDVAIAKMIAETLSFSHENTKSEGQWPTASSAQDIRFNFYLSEGNWCSWDFVPRFGVKKSLLRGQADTITLHGADSFKRNTMTAINSNNRWFATRTLCKDPFAFPILGIKSVGYIGLTCNPVGDENPSGTEFVYNVLNRYTPALLDIPFDRASLPLHPVDPYKAERLTKSHVREPVFWDGSIVAKIAKHLQVAYEKELNSTDRIQEFRVRISRMLSYRIHPVAASLVEEVYRRLPGKLADFENLIMRRVVYLKAMYRPNQQSRALLMDLACVNDLRTFTEIVAQDPILAA